MDIQTVINPKTGRAVKINSAVGKKIVLTPGVRINDTIINPATGRAIKKDSPAGRKILGTEKPKKEPKPKAKKPIPDKVLKKELRKAIDSYKKIKGKDTLTEYKGMTKEQMKERRQEIEADLEASIDAGNKPRESSLRKRLRKAMEFEDKKRNERPESRLARRLREAKAMDADTSESSNKPKMTKLKQALAEGKAQEEAMPKTKSSRVAKRLADAIAQGDDVRPRKMSKLALAIAEGKAQASKIEGYTPPKSKKTKRIHKRISKLYLKTDEELVRMANKLKLGSMEELRGNKKFALIRMILNVKPDDVLPEDVFNDFVRELEDSEGVVLRAPPRASRAFLEGLGEDEDVFLNRPATPVRRPATTPAPTPEARTPRPPPTPSKPRFNLY